MRYTKDLNIGKSIMHVVDAYNDEPVLANRINDLSVTQIEFVAGHIIKNLNSTDLYRCRVVNRNRETIQSIFNILDDRETLVEESKNIVNRLFSIVKKYEGILCGDVLFSLFFHEGQECLAILKFDYQPSFTHQVDFQDGSLSVRLIDQETSLPNAGQKIRKAAFFKKISDEELEVFCVNNCNRSDPDELKSYFTFEFLGIDTVDDPTTLTKKFKDAVSTFSIKYLKDDIQSQLQLHDRAEDELIGGSNIDIVQLAYDAFPNNHQLQADFKEYMGKIGISPSETFPIDKTFVGTKMKAKTIKTDTGITVKAEYDILNDSSKYSQHQNGDGTIDIVIKGVRNIKVK